MVLGDERALKLFLTTHLDDLKVPIGPTHDTARDYDGLCLTPHSCLSLPLSLH